MRTRATKVLSSLGFSLEEMRAFSFVSNDYNRLHIDDQYSSRTPFGEQVVFGIALLLKALAASNQEVSSSIRRLKKLRVDFKKALLLSDLFDLEYAHLNEYYISCAVSRAGEQLARISFEFNSNTTVDPASDKGDLAVEAPVGDSFSNLAEAYRCGSGCTELEAFALLCEGFGWAALPLDVGQLRFLLWTSYFVGMKCPGEQALYTSLKVEFPDGPCSCLYLSGIEQDPRFSMTRIVGSLEDTGSFQIAALQRPLPVDFPLERIRDAVGAVLKNEASSGFSGARAMVTGGSRGFGAVLARALALMRVDVDFSYFRNEEAAELVQQQIVSCGQSSKIYRADLQQAEQSASLFAEPGTYYDMVFLNAMPMIGRHGFVDYTSARWVDRVSQDIAVIANPLRHSLGVLPQKGKVIFISSEFVTVPESGFSAYVAAKAAIEGALAVLAKEHPDLSFFSFRLPRMLTDQTNNPLFLGVQVSPIDVCVEMLELLGQKTAIRQDRCLAVFNLTGVHSGASHQV